MLRSFRLAYSGGSLVTACLLVSCMRFGYEPADELDDSVALAGVGGSLGDGGSMGSFAGAEGSGESTAGGGTSTDTAGATTTGGAASTDAGGATSTDAGGATNTDAGGATSTGTGGAAGTAAVSGAGGATTTGGATSTSTATTSATTGGGDACAAAGTTVYLASFDVDLEGFVVTGAGSPSFDWTGSVGNPELGAVVLDASSGGAMQVRNLTPPGDLSGRVMSVNVYVESGTGVQLILFAESGATGKWADGGKIQATTGQWYCLTLDLDNPPTESAGFDPTDVRIVGVDVQGSGGVVAYFDQFAY